MGKKKISKKSLRKLLGRLDGVERETLVEAKTKRIRKLVAKTRKRDSTYEDWQVKEKCCGKALHKMCSRCPRRILVHVAAKRVSQGDLFRFD